MGEDKGMTIKVFRNVRMGEEGVQTKSERGKKEKRGMRHVSKEKENPFRQSYINMCTNKIGIGRVSFTWVVLMKLRHSN